MARLVLLLLVVTALARARVAFAQSAVGPAEQILRGGEDDALGGAAPAVAPAQPLGDLAGRTVRRVEVVLTGTRWTTPLPSVRSVRAGDRLTAETARRAAREVLDSGAVASAAIEAAPDGEGALLRIVAVPRRTIATLQLSGPVFEPSDVVEAAGVEEGGEITELELARTSDRLRFFYASRGFTAAKVEVIATDTDDPRSVVLRIDVRAGAPRRIAQRVFVIDPKSDRELGELKTQYRIASGARVDEPALDDADRELGELLRQKGFYRARVSHVVRHVGPHSYLYVYLEPGPRVVPTFDGNRAFDSDQLEAALGLGQTTETRPAELVDRIRQFYVTRGFYDVEVSAVERGGADEPVHWLAFTIRENPRVRVVKRVFPCLDRELTANEAGEIIQSFLEELPGGEAFAAPDATIVDEVFGPSSWSGGRGGPTPLNPATTYAPEAYERAVKHLRDVVHARGYLAAVVGPVTAVRARCTRESPPGTCTPEPPAVEVRAKCLRDPLGLPLPEPEVPEALTCEPDPKTGVTCSPTVELRIPIHLGPQTTLYDLAFDGAKIFTEKDLATRAALSLGQPLGNVDVEAARQRLLEAYHDRGYAYAVVQATLEPSSDRTRARVRFSITEREPVIVTGFVLRGATRTSESLVLGRMALKAGLPFRSELARASEERIATLGTFSSVSVSLEDPDVPQRNKRVVVTVVEQLPQFLEPRIGFSTGEGIRFGFEYGHRNIGGQAIQLNLRVQLNYLFDFMIIDQDVRQNYDNLAVSERLERRNTASVTFPEIGLGPLVSLSIDGVDVRDNQRDFGLTKQALGPTVTHRPNRQLSTQLGASVELNDAKIFRGGLCRYSVSDDNVSPTVPSNDCIQGQQVCFRGTPGDPVLPATPDVGICVDEGVSVQSVLRKNPLLTGILRVPEGRTFALAQRLGVTWDRRDNPFAATRGTVVSSSVEHVNAFPAATSDNLATIQSHFLRFTTRVAGYVRLTSKGTALALSVAGGMNVQLASDSQTYPDRLFFLGGVDSIRAFLADSVVPEDVAQRILHPENEPVGTPAVKIEDVGIRGGDLSLNPRAELRIPLSDTFSLGLFLDAGNLWVDPDSVDPFALRYALGSGFRVATPVGPLALDYGINMIRRPWEDFGAFHFSIGLF